MDGLYSLVHMCFSGSSVVLPADGAMPVNGAQC